MDSSGPGLARTLASLLTRGTWVASIVIAAGLLASWEGKEARGAALTTAGIVIVILLPIVRIGRVMAYFAGLGERRFVGLCALVLAIIALSVLVGMQS
jgi:uncharacterized membrane protein